MTPFPSRPTPENLAKWGRDLMLEPLDFAVTSNRESLDMIDESVCDDARI